MEDSGVFQYATDDKCRVTIPPGLRSRLGSKFVMSKGLDRCLFVMAQDNFRSKIIDRLKNESSDVFDRRQRMRERFFADHVEASIDAQSRITIPSTLREYPGINPLSGVVVVGLSDRIEIWNRENWNSFIKGISEDDLSPSSDEAGAASGADAA